MSKRRARSWLRGMPIQLLLWTTVPAIIILILMAGAGVVGHQRAMQDLVLTRDARLARTAADYLSDRLRITIEKRGALTNGIHGMDQEERRNLEQLVADLAPAGEGEAFLIDRQGRVLVASGTSPTPDSLSGQPGVDAVLAGEAGATIAAIDGTDMVIGYAPIPPAGWGLIIQEPWDVVVGPMMRFSLVVPLILALAAVAALISIIFGLRSIAHPLQQLDRQAARLAWGEFEAVKTPVGGTQEIEDLRRTLNHLAQQIQAYRQGMRDYIGAITRGQEEERKRLARELHDDTVQDLIALGHRIEMARRALEYDPQAAAERLDELRALVGETITDVRRFTRALRPIYLEDLGLLPALEMLVQDVGEKAGIAGQFQVSGSSRRLPEELELTIFRIAQEALTNVVQHAQATQVEVKLHFAGHEVVLTIADDGVGFDVPERPEGLARRGHFGLLGMQERAALVGGRLVLESEAGRGTRVTAHLPSPESSSDLTSP
ncbi:MAG: HAMP domain-containing protein [Chloroflexi bacterium]|nr:MAG: HAMP domain-containing protein [Chloroflexota bacterium]